MILSRFLMDLRNVHFTRNLVVGDLDVDQELSRNESLKQWWPTAPISTPYKKSLKIVADRMVARRSIHSLRDLSELLALNRELPIHFPLMEEAGGLA